MQLFIWRKISCPKTVSPLISNSDEELDEVQETNKQNSIKDMKIASK